MTAWFQAEFNMKMARDNGVFDGDSTARNSGVGLRGGFGNVYFGTWETPWSQTFRLWDVGTIGGWGPTTAIIGRREQTGTNPSRNCANNTGAAGQAALPVPPICGNGSESTNGPNGNLGYSLWRRYNYAVFYESPLFAGVQGKVAWQPNERKSDFVTPTATTVNENPSSWSASLTWTGLGGRARAFAATMQNKDWTTVGQKDGGFTVGGGYDFGVVNVGATYEDYTYKVAAGDMKAKEWAVGLAVPLGPGKIGASYAKAKKLTGAGTDASEAAGTNDTGAKLWNLGYEWALSKRTALGFGVAKIDNGANQVFSWTATLPDQTGWRSGAVLAGVDITNVFVSMRHSF
jgi:predicted porin